MSDLSRPAIVRTFMTHDMSDADIVAVSTGREVEFDRIMAAISRSLAAAPGALQHVVLYGSRGFGKSFMMRRVQIALGQEPAGDRPTLFLLLPEEQHNLQKSPHALLDYISALLARDESNAAFAEAMFQWPKPGEAARRWVESAAKLEQLLDKVLPGGNGLVVVAVENFDTLLATLFSDGEDEQRLRDWLFRRKNRIMLLATATGTVDMDYDRPLFQAFEPVRLTPWSNEDCISYFNRKRESEGKPQLDARQEAKARAVAEFIGGTPRLAQLLGDVIETEDALSVSATMDALADRLAEYYRRRIDDLAPLVRGLLDALIRGGEPASQTELAQRVGAEGQSQIARAMGDLQRADIICGRPALDSRETLYSVTDRVFAHYYRLRQGSRAADATPLAAILDFLRSFYSQEEQRAHGLRHLLEGRPAEGALLSRLAMKGSETQRSLFVEGFEFRLRAYLSAATVPFGEALTIGAQLADKPEKLLQECQDAASDAPVDAAIRAALRAQAVFRLGPVERADKELQTTATAVAADLAARIVTLCELVFFFETTKNGRHLAADLGASLEGADLSPLPPALACQAYRMLGRSLSQLGRHSDALETLARAAELARQVEDKREEAACLRYTGWVLGELGRHSDALEILARAAELARQVEDKGGEAECLRYTGLSLGQLGQHADAIDTLTRAVEQARQIGDEEELCRSIAAALGQAMHVPMPGISGLFAEWVRIVRQKPDLKTADPRPSNMEFLLAAVRAGELDAIDTMTAEHGEWLTSNKMLHIDRTHGTVLADIATEGGRAAGWEATAALLPRIAQLQAKAPEGRRDRIWLSDLVFGFAQDCRDPGLLRDIAALLTPDLSPEAKTSAALLIDLARVDEADDPERVLSRLDPDRALLIRRLRGLPDQEPKPPVKSGRRK